MEDKIKITLSELEFLLDRQKRAVIDRLYECSGYYNSKSSPGIHAPLPIDKEKFIEKGMDASYPNDFEVLKKYLK